MSTRDRSDSRSRLRFVREAHLRRRSLHQRSRRAKFAGRRRRPGESSRAEVQSSRCPRGRDALGLRGRERRRGMRDRAPRGGAAGVEERVHGPFPDRRIGAVAEGQRVTTRKAEARAGYKQAGVMKNAQGSTTRIDGPASEEREERLPRPRHINSSPTARRPGRARSSLRTPRVLRLPVCGRNAPPMIVTRASRRGQKRKTTATR